MSDNLQELRFLTIRYDLPPDDLKVLRTAAARIKNKDKTKIDAVHWCRLYLPTLSQKDAELFLHWLAKQSV